MPRITIQEEDLTQATGSVGTDIPFIPGFSDLQYNYRLFKADTDADKTRYTYQVGMGYIESSEGNYVRESDISITPLATPTLCNSVADFERLFGYHPIEIDSDTTYGITTDILDKSYIMARELLNQGMPIYYWTPDFSKPITLDLLSYISCNHGKVDGKILTMSLSSVNTEDITIKLNRKIYLDDSIIINIESSDDLSNIDVTLINSEDGTLNKNADGAYEFTCTNTAAAGINEIQLNISINSVESIDGWIKISVTNNVDDTVSANPTIGEFYTHLSNYLNSDDLEDKDTYTIKYITSGGYPNIDKTSGSRVNDYGLVTKMINIAEKRQDCIALIEGPDMLNVNNIDIYAAELHTQNNISRSYATMFIPWADYNLTKTYKLGSANIAYTAMPACFGYLSDLALNIKTSNNWLAMAGTTRGLVPRIRSLRTDGRLSNVVANKWQPTRSSEGNIAINAITNITPYGLTIWGNRTLKNIEEQGLTATNFLNTRNMISDIKKVSYRVAKSLIYEQNAEALWIRFKSQVSPLLEQLKAGNGISDYKLLRLNTTYIGKSLGKEEFACAIQIYPMYAVETFEITVVVSDSEVSVEG